MPKRGDIIDLITRRALLKKAGSAFLFYTSAKSGLNPLKVHPAIVEETRIVMGSASRIIVSGWEEEKLSSFVEEAFGEMKRLEGLMTLYSPESEISRLNLNGAASLGAECVEVLKQAIFFSKQTRGAFDITTRTKKGEDAIELQHSMDYNNIELRFREARFKGAGMAVDLGGIGIGYAVDRAIEVLRKRGVKSALVDGGGEVKAMGGRSDKLSWRVGIRDPFRKSEFTDVINLDDRAMSTSGNYEMNHIIDPKTGKYPCSLVSATVISKDALSSDALSTAVFVLGEEAGLSLIEETPDTEGLLVTTKGRILKSKGFKNYNALGRLI
jgi:thiamine biosynthesis lipoprotein